MLHQAKAKPHLQFTTVTKRFEGHTAVCDVSFDLVRGEFCVLLGPSGAGKSTLLRLINGLETSDLGTVSFDGVDVEPASLRKIRPRMATVHQQFHLATRLNVLRNVLAGALPKISTVRSLLGLFPRELQRRACDLLQRVGLRESQLYVPAGQLSGGEQQRVAVARAFILRPELVLADEPVASLDPETSRTILSLLRTAAKQESATVLCSLHQVELAKEFADRVIGMRDGKLVFDDMPDQLDDAALKTIYGEEQKHAV